MAQGDKATIKSIFLDFSFSCVDAHAHTDGCLSPIFRLQINLRFHRSTHCIPSCMKCRAKSIANHLEHITIVGLDDLSQNLIMARLCNCHCLRMLSPQLSAAFDIGI